MMFPDQLKTLVEEMCESENRAVYCPILEADLSGFLYHLILSKGICSPARIHLDTRVVESTSKNNRFDVVIGELARRQDDRPAVSPEVVIEIKMFPYGFTDQQHRVHFEHVLNDDLRKLASVKGENLARIEFLFDQVDYLDGTYSGRLRRDVLLARRAETAAGVNFLLAQRKAENWEVVVT